LKLFIHEYSGHAFGLQLARELARQGHTVTHGYSAAIESPRGATKLRPDDPPGLAIRPIGVPGSLNKYALLHRVIEERRYGVLLAEEIHKTDPDAVIIGTTPNDVLDVLRKHLSPGLRLVWWLQDIYSVGIRSVLNRKIFFAGDIAGWVYRDKERRFAARSNRIVSITSDFIPFLEGLGVRREKISVIENWGAPQDIQPQDSENSWKCEQGFSGKRLILYSGTLGLKHNPAILSDLAQHLKNWPEFQVVIVTQGLGADFLRAEQERRSLHNMSILPWQPYERLAETLSSAEILIAIIEPDAGLFSVPSKILSCLCAGRPIVAAIPSENLAARMIVQAQAGIVVRPDDSAGFIREICGLLADPSKRNSLGANGRAYAEKQFDIGAIAARFLKVLQD